MKKVFGEQVSRGREQKSLLTTWNVPGCDIQNCLLWKLLKLQKRTHAFVLASPTPHEQILCGTFCSSTAGGNSRSKLKEDHPRLLGVIGVAGKVDGTTRYLGCLGVLQCLQKYKYVVAKNMFCQVIGSLGHYNHMNVVGIRTHQSDSSNLQKWPIFPPRGLNCM
jgi:hypothetical protein